MNKGWIIFFVVVGLGLTVFFLNKLGIGSNNGNPISGNYDEFAKCLSEKGVAMYGAYWCGHCSNQKEMFGDSFQYVNYVECTENQDLCDEKGVSGYPTWIVNSKNYPGEQTFEKLSELTGCDLNG